MAYTCILCGEIVIGSCDCYKKLYDKNEHYKKLNEMYEAGLLAGIRFATNKFLINIVPVLPVTIGDDLVNKTVEYLFKDYQSI